MDYDRLRELQEKFEENPRRYFAPLANEYRKGGQPKRAIEICRSQLAQMPGHMSGQIVFGQALYEAGEFDEARQVFERALTLDPENLIALRSLGDMSLQSGDTTEARRWYMRLLDADPKDTAGKHFKTFAVEAAAGKTYKFEMAGQGGLDPISTKACPRANPYSSHRVSLLQGFLRASSLMVYERACACSLCSGMSSCSVCLTRGFMVGAASRSEMASAIPAATRASAAAARKAA